MKIVVDGRLILPYMTGLGRYLLGLCQALSLEAKPELEFELLLQKRLPANHRVWQLGSSHFHLRSLSMPHMSLSQQWGVPLDRYRHPADLLHYPHFDLPFLTPGPVVATIHDLKYIARPDFFPHVAGVKRLVMWAMMAFTVRRAKFVITISENSRQDCLRFLKADPRKLRVIPLGVEERYFHPAKPDEVEGIRQKYGVSDPYILFVSERRPHKNIPTLIRAFEIFCRIQSRPYHLVICGRAYQDYQEPERLVENMELMKRIHFIHVDDEDLPAVYQAADAFALLSFYEGFGLPVIEAMASGTPVVALDATSLSEVVGQAGLLVPPTPTEAVAEMAATALSQVVEGGALREQMIAAGKQRAAGYTWRACAESTLAIYEKAVSPLRSR